jgi:hypothetical protein
MLGDYFLDEFSLADPAASEDQHKFGFFAVDPFFQDIKFGFSTYKHDILQSILLESI